MLYMQVLAFTVKDICSIALEIGKKLEGNFVSEVCLKAEIHNMTFAQICSPKESTVRVSLHIFSRWS